MIIRLNTPRRQAGRPPRLGLAGCAAPLTLTGEPEPLRLYEISEPKQTRIVRARNKAHAVALHRYDTFSEAPETEYWEDNPEQTIAELSTDGDPGIVLDRYE